DSDRLRIVEEGGSRVGYLLLEGLIADEVQHERQAAGDLGDEIVLGQAALLGLHVEQLLDDAGIVEAEREALELGRSRNRLGLVRALQLAQRNARELAADRDLADIGGV